jgi:1-acyl-sn-glycerol-3-phosphate acyltransferase
MLLLMQAALGKAILDAAGWTIVGGAPNVARCVLIAAPHTSNWDFLYAIACTSALGLPLRFMAKDSLFRGAQGALLRALGGIAIDRSKANNVVDAMVQEFERGEPLVLLIPPEGTRKARDYWKSGFYHIARGAGVPVALGFLDYPNKRVGIGPLVELSGDVKSDMDRIRAFYADKGGKVPASFTPPRLREEDAS